MGQCIPKSFHFAPLTSITRNTLYYRVTNVSYPDVENSIVSVYYIFEFYILSK